MADYFDDDALTPAIEEQRVETTRKSVIATLEMLLRALGDRQIYILDAKIVFNLGVGSGHFTLAYENVAA